MFQGKVLAKSEITESGKRIKINNFLLQKITHNKENGIAG